jgi:putative ABC transport system substrate-binding protein
MAAKRLELLRELMPGATTIGLLVNPANPNALSETTDVQAAARALGLQIPVANASSERDIDAAFAGFVQARVNAIFIGGDPFFTSRRVQVAVLAARHAIPTSHDARSSAEARQVGLYTGRILKGERPADLPVQQSVKFELVLNLKTAKTLSLEVPAKLLALADAVIE